MRSLFNCNFIDKHNHLKKTVDKKFSSSTKVPIFVLLFQKPVLNPILFIYCLQGRKLGE